MSFHYFLFDQISESGTKVYELDQICNFKILAYAVDGVENLTKALSHLARVGRVADQYLAVAGIGEIVIMLHPSAHRA